ncbi:MAG: Histidine--tRNA ligase [Synergistales bacterium 54_24]|nr:MAG: Histidine--tRNA ligase [Synergistales bacterium 54_24]HAF51070.1 histidine--tRNA ligase [Synergistaceae bacterium]
MVAIKAPRGVRDILPDESWKWAYVLEVASEVADLFGYREVYLPIFEDTALFARGIGDTTDVVEKEMYTFTDRSGRSLTLRPEATASMVRCYLEHGMQRERQPAKLWCSGPMFRYERPQKGRYRQFWQLDFEAIGVQDPMVDVETVALSLELFRRLGLSNLEVMVNSVGCPRCRPTYREKLKAYLAPHLDELCDSCRARFERNPLRTLDCKEEGCIEITQGAPDVVEHLCEECRSHFDQFLNGLEAIRASYRLNKRLVRGLDYYTKTAFEVTSGKLGAQNAVCGGGRYDHLAEAIGGPFTPGVGFAAGIERVILSMEEEGASFGERPSIDAFVVTAEASARPKAVSFLHELRRNGLRCDMDYAGKGMRGQLKAASSSGARFACILGSEELSRGAVAVKDLSSGEQREFPLERAAEMLKTILQGQAGG